MPETLTYPGVYIEEMPSPVHPIAAVATSIAAFIDFFSRGPMNQAVQLFSFADVERDLGGLETRSEASYALQQFFINGGTEAWVVRVAGGSPATATAVIRNGIGGGAVTALTASAGSPGAWGGRLRILVDRVRPDPDGVFNLTVIEYGNIGGKQQAVQSEVHLNLVMNPASTNFVEKVVNGNSSLVQVTASGTTMPLACGTVSDAIGPTVTLGTPAALPSLAVTVGPTTAPATFSSKPSGAVPLAEVAALVEAAIRAARPDDPTFASATVEVLDGTRLRILAGPGDPSARITFAANAGDSQTITDLKLTGAAVTANVQQYVFGTAAVPNTAQAGGTAGADGDPPDAGALTAGLSALDAVDLVNIVCLPRVARVDGDTPFDPGQVGTVISAATSYCEQRRAFLLVDTPSDVRTVPKFRQLLSATLDSRRDRNAAVYFPRVISPDPLDDFRPRSFGASGTIAGLFARTDATRGVWKAPAGTEASLRNVQRLDVKLTDAENGVLNPLGVNCLRTFAVYGNVCWGARTLAGSDQQASEWKYVPVRRLALFLEESLFRGTKWVVFEPNDAPLWAQIRLNVGAFMHDLFRQGAFQGQTPREAYLVKCDGETTTQTDIDRGIVNIVVGFAPLKPAEFVIIRIQQLAGQIET